MRKYSTLELTYKSDRLLAIDGLACKAAEFLKMTYLAGLWKEDLPYPLLWYASGLTKTTRLKEYGLSWSWSSIDGEIVPALSAATLTDHIDMADGIFEAQITEIGNNPEKRSSHGRPLHRGHISMKSKKIPLRFDCQQGAFMIIGPRELAYDTSEKRVFLDVSDWSEFQKADDVLLFILFYFKPDRGDYSRPCAMGLILRRADPIAGLPPGKKYYKRIGCYRDCKGIDNSALYSQFEEDEICLL